MPLFRPVDTPVAHISKAFFLPYQSVNLKSNVKENFQWMTSEILMPLDMHLLSRWYQ